LEGAEVLTRAERRHWERTDDIIINVLRRCGGLLGGGMWVGSRANIKVSKPAPSPLLRSTP
jgi:hypothetical protein